MAHQEKDLELAQSVVDGSVEAWHRFIDRYSALIYSVIRRYLAGESEDEWRTMYVEVLKSLYEQKLEVYDGSSALSTWVTLITRRSCLDHLRRRLGRRDPPGWLVGLSDRDQQVYRLYYLEGFGYPEICRQLSSEGEEIGTEELSSSFDNLDAHLSKSLRRRLAYDLRARSMGERRGRVAEYLENLREEYRERSERESPEKIMEEKKVQERLDRLRAILNELPESDREMLQLHYYDGWTARRIAHEKGLAGQRRAYTLITRGLRRMKKLFEERERPATPTSSSSDSRAGTENAS